MVDPLGGGGGGGIGRGVDGRGVDVRGDAVPAAAVGAAVAARVGLGVGEGEAVAVGTGVRVAAVAEEWLGRTAAVDDCGPTGGSPTSAPALATIALMPTVRIRVRAAPPKWGTGRGR
jgi:hypothetical protein